jgi:two-component system sensor histidine kinase HydH
VDDERERLAQMGELLGSVLHELRNPLGVIESSLYLIKQKPDDSERQAKHLARIGEQVGRARHIITGLLSLLHDQPLDLGPVELLPAIREAIATLDAKVPFELSVEGSVRAERTLLLRAIANLAENAQRAAHTSVRFSTREVANRIELRVHDDGDGVAPNVAARLFQPLVTNRPEGTGLGLALSKRIAERLGGTLAYESGAGATFVLTLEKTT